MLTNVERKLDDCITRQRYVYRTHNKVTDFSGFTFYSSWRQDAQKMKKENDVRAYFSRARKIGFLEAWEAHKGEHRYVKEIERLGPLIDKLLIIEKVDYVTVYLHRFEVHLYDPEMWKGTQRLEEIKAEVNDVLSFFGYRLRS